MEKRLDLGLVVNNEEYYQLLMWKDKNMDAFRQFLDINKIQQPSINYMLEDQYKRLLKYSGIKVEPVFTRQDMYSAFEAGREGNPDSTPFNNFYNWIDYYNKLKNK